MTARYLEISGMWAVIDRPYRKESVLGRFFDAVYDKSVDRSPG